MHYYLSSYLLGNETEYLKRQSKKYSKITYIYNAKDVTGADIAKIEAKNKLIMKELKEVGFEPEILNLKDYIGKKDTLAKKLEEFDGMFIRGGNVFVLRQIMKLSGLDEILVNYHNRQTNFFYMGYSAGICVLAPSLKGMEMVDPLDESIYVDKIDIVWEGLGILDYTLVPHYKSDHSEALVTKDEIEYYIENKILFKALKDGEVEIITNFPHEE